MGGIGDGLMPRPDPYMISDQASLTPDPNPVQVGANQDPAAYGRGVHRVIVAAQTHIVIPGQPQRVLPSGRGGTGGRANIAALSAAIRSAGAQPNDRLRRVLASCSHRLNWVLKSAGESKLRPGRKLRSR